MNIAKTFLISLQVIAFTKQSEHKTLPRQMQKKFFGNTFQSRDRSRFRTHNI